MLSISPSSGPTLGATEVHISLPSLPSPANHTCRFGQHVVHASVAVDGSSAVRCYSPAAPSGSGFQPLHYSLNGQQYTDSDAMYNYYLPLLHLSSAAPASGPLLGGTDVLLSGSGLWGAGSHPTCFFGAAATAASRATEHDTLRCVAPRAGDDASPQSLRVSLNGQQYSPPVVGGFSRYLDTVVSSLTPNGGPATGGGTVITVQGVGFGAAPGVSTKCALQPDALHNSAADLIVTMAATLAADGSILCSPTPSHLALLAEPTSSPVGAEALRF